MPTYEYACRSCSHELEAVQAFTDPPLTDCPACGGPLRKVFSAVGIAFKGTGFYKNDSRSSTGRAAAKADKGGGEKGAGAKGGTDKGGTDKGAGDAKAPTTSGGSGSGGDGGTAKPAPKSEPKAATSS